MVRVLRFLAFAVLVPFVPLVRVVFLAIAVLGFVSCVVYQLLLHVPHFPLGAMLLMSLSLCVGAAALGALMQYLEPR